MVVDDGEAFVRICIAIGQVDMEGDFTKRHSRDNERLEAAPRSRVRFTQVPRQLPLRHA